MSKFLEVLFAFCVFAAVTIGLVVLTFLRPVVIAVLFVGVFLAMNHIVHFYWN